MTCHFIGPFLVQLETFVNKSKLGSYLSKTFKRSAMSLLAVSALSGMGSAFAAWEPTKPVEFVVPAGTGGGADQIRQEGRLARSTAADSGACCR